MADQRPVVLVHGYAASVQRFGARHKALEDYDADLTEIHACTYQTLTNEVTIKNRVGGRQQPGLPRPCRR